MSQEKTLSKLKPLIIGDLELPVPIIQGGMGIGVSLKRLASAVAACGGGGVISLAQIGFREPIFSKNAFEANLRGIQSEISGALESIAEIKNKGAIGVNIMCAGHHYKEYVKAAVEAGTQMIISGAGLPTNLPGICSSRKVKLIPIVSSVRAATLLMRTWVKRYSRFPDAIVFEGPEAGGHLGFNAEELESEQNKYYETIEEIRNEIDKNLKKADSITSESGTCPLIAAGGIFDRYDIDKALAHGAQGVQMGTRFVATYECDIDDSFKETYVKATKDDIVIIKSPVGMPGRAIKNEFVQRIQKERVPIQSCNNCLIPCNPAEAPYCITGALTRSAEGDAEGGLIFCGSKAYKIDKIIPVQDLMNELTGSL